MSKKKKGKKKLQASRSFESAKKGRLTADWLNARRILNYGKICELCGIAADRW